MAEPVAGVAAPEPGSSDPLRSSSSGLSTAGSDVASETHSVVVTVVGAETPAASTPPLSKSSNDAAAPAAHSRTWRWRLVNLVIIPACLPLFAVYWLLALLLALGATLTIVPSLLLARRLYWVLPFIPFIWTNPRGLRARVGVVGSWLLRLQFEGAHCTTVLSRLLTLPLRPHVPDFLLLGFPVRSRGASTLHVQRRGTAEPRVFNNNNDNNSYTAEPI
jgi:hypothetical protein